MPGKIAGAAQIAAYGRSVRTQFNKYFDLVEDHAGMRLSLRVDDEGDIVDYPIPEALPQMREWKGGRAHKGFKLGVQSIRSLPYEATLDFPGHHIRLGKMRQYLPRIDQLARKAKVHPIALLGTLLNNAFGTTKAHDGKALCATNHSVGRRPAVTISNKGTAALDGDAFAEGRAALFSFQDESQSYRWSGGESLALVVSPDLEDTARQIVKAEYVSTGGTNVRQGQAEVIVLPHLHDNPAYWFISVMDFPPFVFQVQEALMSEFVSTPEAQAVYDEDAYSLGVRARYAMGVGDYRSIWGSDGTA